MNMANLDNALVAQKDAVIMHIDNGDFNVAIDRLCFVAELWIACDYAYKGRELCERLTYTARQLNRKTPPMLLPLSVRFADAVHAWYASSGK
jgi:hypothetical protein